MPTYIMLFVDDTVFLQSVLHNQKVNIVIVRVSHKSATWLMLTLRHCSQIWCRL